MYYGGNDMNTKELYSTPGILELMLIMQNTMREEFIIVKHDIQHLKFISGNMDQEGFNEIQGYAETLENLVEKSQKHLQEIFTSYFKKENKNQSVQCMELTLQDIVYKFNNLRISYMKTLDLISNELDFLHKTIAEHLYSLPPMIDPVRRYKRKIDKDELTVLTNISRSYTERFDKLLELLGVTDGKGTDDKTLSNNLPLIFVDYSASTKLSNAELNKRISNILNFNSGDKESSKKDRSLTGFIKLPYWAIKITEYTSAIAHEIVHLYLHHEKHKSTDKNELESLKDNLYDALAKTSSKNGHGYRLPSTWSSALHSFTEEVLVDLIAFFVAGPAYYFTLFMQGTARYPGHHNIIRKSTLMYARIIILTEFFKNLLKKSNLYIDEKFIQGVNGRTINLEKISDEYKKKLANQEGKLTFEDIEANNVFVINKMLYAADKYIKYILDVHKNKAYGDRKTHSEAESSTIFQKDTLEETIAKKILSYINTSLFISQATKSNWLKKLLSDIRNNRDPQNKKKEYARSIYKQSNLKFNYEFLKNYLLKVMPEKNEEEQKFFHILQNLKKIVANFSNNKEYKQIELQDSVVGFNTNSVESDEFSYYYLIPEYLWENTLININLFVSRQKTGNKTSTSEEPSAVNNKWYDTRLPKLQIARILATEERKNLFMTHSRKTENEKDKNLDNEEEQLIITEIKEWLFTKVDWKATYEKLKTSVSPEQSGKDFNTGIVQTFNRLIKEKISQDGVNIKTGFVLGDYDFIIELNNASTRKDINWPPAKYNDNKDLITNYSYREYIVEKIEKANNNGAAKRREGNDKEPYVLQFIRFKSAKNNKSTDNKSVDDKWLKKIILNFLENGFEVYLSNSWNIIFIKAPISKLVDDKGIFSKKTIYEKELSIIFKEDSKKGDLEYVEDIQSYIVFPCSDNSNCKCTHSNKIELLNMKSIIKTSGAIESKTEYEETKIKNVIQGIIQSIKNNNSPKAYFTLGIIDYIIDWGKIKLCDAINIAMLLINRLSSMEYKHISTLTSISVLDSNNYNKRGID